jgi:hypothetical protein
VHVSGQIRIVYCGAVGGGHISCSDHAGPLGKVGTHTFHKTGQNQAPSSAATSRKVWCKDPRRWKRVVARKIRYVTSLMVTGRWSYVAWLFPIIRQRMEVSHPPLCTQFSSFVRTLENQSCHLWERAMYLKQSCGPARTGTSSGMCHEPLASIPASIHAVSTRGRPFSAGPRCVRTFARG